MAKINTQNAFEEEIFFSIRQQRNMWMRVAIGSIAIAALSLTTLIIILPLSESKPYVVLVDKTTGEAEKIVEVRAATIEQRDAVLQAELVSYVTDRETYDKSDSQVRIPDVLSRSTGEAAETLSREWTSDSPAYPPTVYGDKARVVVSVKSISLIKATIPGGNDVAQVRIVKKREEFNRVVAERAYVVTVGFDFVPNKEATLASVWKNPLGFTATTYRIDAENL